MIRKILIAGIGMIISGLARSQHINNDAVNAEIMALDNSGNAITTDGNGFDLPGEGNISSYKANSISYSATLKRHRLQGKWESWYTNDNLCDSGSFVKGIPDGEWKHWDISGRLLSIRTYNADKLLRVKNEMSRSHPRSSAYPLTSLYMKNRKRAQQYIQAGYSFSFKGQLPDKFSLQQAVENNITPGNGYRPVFNECLHHGLYMNFFSDGRTRDSGYYKNGLRDAIWLQRNVNDNSYFIGAYKNGIQQGDWKQYNATGKFIAIIFYNKKGEEEWKKKIRN
jgi:antitoxin component YwqK of YwqJK toxin-antitoxin module